MDSVLCNTPLSFILNQKRALMNVTSYLDLDYRQASYLAPELVYNYYYIYWAGTKMWGVLFLC